jgi:hypothetical protein
MLIFELIELLKTITCSQETLDTARFTENSFTRNRGMSFPDALAFMLDMRKTTLQTRLNLYFERVKGGDPISQQAFSKLRMNFDHSPFETMARELVKKEYSGQYQLPLWNGYHVFAIDGSYLQLPRVDALRDEFGVRGARGKGGGCPSAGISVLYDVLHGWALDPIITQANMNERVECEKHIGFLSQKLAHITENSIITIDRGYPSLDLLKKLQNSRLKYLARCKSQYVPEIDTAPKGDSVATLENDVSVRIIKFELPSGEIETLVTNLFDLEGSLFPELYALRWKIENAYFILKRELCVEKFTGKTPNSIRQDFWAGMVLLNSVAVFQEEADEVVQERYENKPVKHEYRARTSGLIVTLRDRFIFAVLCGVPMLAPEEMEHIIRMMAREVSPIRPGRSYPRHFKPNLNVNHNLKSHL